MHLLLLLLKKLLFDPLLTFPLEARELLRRMHITLRLHRFLRFAQRSRFLRLSLLVGNGLAFPSQLPHSINDSKMSIFSPSLNTNGLVCPPSGCLSRNVLSTLLLLLDELLLGLMLSCNSSLCLLEATLVGTEVLCLGHLRGQSFKLHPPFEALPRCSSARSSYKH
jgi:hypothetical protein